MRNRLRESIQRYSRRDTLVYTCLATLGGVIHSVNGSREDVSIEMLCLSRKLRKSCFCEWMRSLAVLRSASLKPTSWLDDATRRPVSSNVSLIAVVSSESSCFWSKLPPGKT